jgi:hypothetical protein
MLHSFMAQLALNAEHRSYCATTPTGMMLQCLLVERLGVGGGGSDVSVTGSLVGASGELEGSSSLEVGVARRGVRSGVVLLEVEVGKLGEHLISLGW